MTLIDSATNTFSFDMNGIDLIGDYHEGTPEAPDPNAIIITGARIGSNGNFVHAGYFEFNPHLGGWNFTDGHGGGSSTSILPAKPGVVHTTKEGHTYLIDLSLSLSQTLVLDQIVDYGMDNGFNAKEIAVAAVDAYYESSLSPGKFNGSHYGLFQYNSETWVTNNEAGSVFSPTAQIAAIFNDIARYEVRYTAALADPSNGLGAAGLTFGQYFEIKHELGNTVTDWFRVNPVTGNSYVSDWANAQSRFHIH